MRASVSDQALGRLAVAGWLLTIGIKVAALAIRVATRLKDNADLDNLATEVRAVVGATIAPASVGVWLHPSERMANR